MRSDGAGWGLDTLWSQIVLPCISLFPPPQSQAWEAVSCAWGVSALTLPVPGLSLQPSLKRITEEQAEESLLQEAEVKALAEVTAQGKGCGHSL